MNPSINKNRSSMIDDYIIIAEYTPNNNIKLYNLISKEENPLLYHSLINKKLDFTLKIYFQSITIKDRF
ncbi:hypothetical protein ClosIBUN22A_CONTIG19g00330 [Clostridium sp. IBUN22A]|nr:hypothetical protein ClosIBUN22A_CONTIG19g00330 [Clostridium sp. IBUN22A]